MSGHVLSQPLFTLKIAPRVWASGRTPSDTWFFETHSSQRSERHHGRFSCFCGAHGRDRQTDGQITLYSVCSNRPQLADVAMRPNMQLPTTLVVQVEQSVCVCPYLCVRVTITFELRTGTVVRTMYGPYVRMHF